MITPYPWMTLDQVPLGDILQPLIKETGIPLISEMHVALAKNPTRRLPAIATGLHFFVFGRWVEASPPYPWRWWGPGDEQGQPINTGRVVQVWCERGFFEDSLVYAEILWHPETGTHESIRGLENDSSPATLKRVSAALEYLQWRWQDVRPGRKAGDYDMPCPELRERVIAAVGDILKERRTVNQEEVAHRLGIHPVTLSNRGKDCLGRGGLRRLMRGLK